MSICYLNDTFLDTADAKISVEDIAIMRGAGSFEYLRTYQRHPFLLNEHIERFINSCKWMGFSSPKSAKELTEIVYQLIEKNLDFTECGVKFIASGGKTQRGIEFDANPPTLFLLCEQYVPLPDKWYLQGGRLITYEHLRTLPQAKTTNYLQSVVLKEQKKQHEAIDVLYTYHNYLLEGSTCNIFFFIKNELITPKENILIGTTRNYILKKAQSKFTVTQRNIAAEEIPDFSEAFVTSTNREVLPIVKIDDQLVGNGEVGNNTKYVMRLFEPNCLNKK